MWLRNLRRASAKGGRFRPLRLLLMSLLGYIQAIQLLLLATSYLLFVVVCAIAPIGLGYFGYQWLGIAGAAGGVLIGAIGWRLLHMLQTLNHGS